MPLDEGCSVGLVRLASTKRGMGMAWLSVHEGWDGARDGHDLRKRPCAFSV